MLAIRHADGQDWLLVGRIDEPTIAIENAHERDMREKSLALLQYMMDTFVPHQAAKILRCFYVRRFELLFKGAHQEINRLDRAIGLFGKDGRQFARVHGRVTECVGTQPPNGQSHCQTNGARQADGDGY